MVASPKIVSPSITVWMGTIARARPSWPIIASLLAPALSNVTSVATTASVVAVPGTGAGGGAGATGATEPNSPSSPARRPWGRPVMGSSAEPTALSTTSAATVSAVVEHRARRPDPALATPDDGARARPDDPLCDRPFGRGVERGGPGGGRRAGTERPAAAQVEHHGGGHDRHDAAGDREPDARRFQAGHDAVRGGEPVGRPTRQHDGVHALDGGVRPEQVGFAGAGRGAAHVDARDGAVGRCEHHRGARKAALDLGVADPQACDVGQGVERSWTHVSIMVDFGAECAAPGCPTHLWRGAGVPHCGQNGVPWDGAPQPPQAGGASGQPHWPQKRPAVAAPQLGQHAVGPVGRPGWRSDTRGAPYPGGGAW